MVPRSRENRKSARFLMRRGAEVIFDAPELPIRCVVLDLSDSGARLSFANPIAGLTRNFTLVLFNDASVRRDCEVVWTDSRSAGVKFVGQWYGAVKTARHLTPNDARAKKPLTAKEQNGRVL
jgi:hypothetical protein